MLQGGVIKGLHCTRDSRENVALQISVFEEKEGEGAGVDKVNLKGQPKWR